jgi:hypothetical protein
VQSDLNTAFRRAIPEFFTLLQNAAVKGNTLQTSGATGALVFGEIVSN